MADDLERLTAALADRYAIQHELGRGGMATVYLAEDTKLERRVAIKVLKPELAAVLGDERFLREVKITAGLEHPHILGLYDSGAADGFLYYVMPYVAGESLRDRLDREKQLPVEEALQISREVADALSYAHSHDVIHRDIKPENILLESGHAVVADFGIARAITAAGGDRLTETGLAIGTPTYMSPEQAAGSRELDGRSDLYSLGCVLYEMLAGQPPFTGPTVESVIKQHLAAEPSAITNIRPSVPAEVMAALSRALAKTPADRFNPVAQFGEAIAPRLSVEAPATTTPARPRRWLWAAAAAVAMAGAVWFVTRSGGSVAEAAPADLPRLVVRPLENLGPAEDAYFAEGITDEITGRLGALQGTIVLPFTTAARYRDLTVRQLADSLEVDYVLEGRVRWQRTATDSSRARLSLVLVRAADEAQLWSHQRDLVLRDVFVVQVEVADSVAHALGQRLATSGVAVAARPTDGSAYTLYLRGMDRWRRGHGTGGPIRAAMALWDSAIARDSGLALAWVMLSRGHNALFQQQVDRSPARRQLQLDAAKRAVDLDSNLAAAQDALAGALNATGDTAGARLARERATTLNPSRPGSLGDGERLMREGRHEEAFSFFERYLAVDPLDYDRHWNVAARYWYGHFFDRADSLFARAIAINSAASAARIWRGLLHIAWRGDVARAQLEWTFRTPRLPWAASNLNLFRLPLRLAGSQGVRPTVTDEDLRPRHPDASARLLNAAVWFQRNSDSATARRLCQAALPVLDSAHAVAPEEPIYRSGRGIAHACLGDARRAIEEAEAAAAGIGDPPGVYWEESRLLNLAQVYMMVGQPDRAVETLERLVGDVGLITPHWLRVDPLWEPLRGHPRFQRLVAREVVER